MDTKVIRVTLDLATWRALRILCFNENQRVGEFVSEAISAKLGTEALPRAPKSKGGRPRKEAPNFGPMEPMSVPPSPGNRPLKELVEEVAATGATIPDKLLCWECGQPADGKHKSFCATGDRMASAT